MQCDPGNRERSDDRANIRAGVKNSRCQRALLFWKPLGGSFDRSGKIAGLADAESCARDAKAESRSSQRMSHRGQTPDRQRRLVADLCPEAIDQATCEQKSKRASRIE